MQIVKSNILLKPIAKLNRLTPVICLLLFCFCLNLNRAKRFLLFVTFYHSRFSGGPNGQIRNVFSSEAMSS